MSPERDFPLGPGPATGLPEYQRRLHRAQMRAIREQRQAEQAAKDEDERWPGLVEPDPEQPE